MGLIEKFLHTLSTPRWGVHPDDHKRPAADAPLVDPDLLLVPLLAFDRRGGRLGYGGGYYDRTLAALPNALNVALMARYIADFGAPLALAGALVLMRYAQNPLYRRRVIYSLAACLTISVLVLSGMMTEAMRIKAPIAHYQIFGATYRAR